MPATTADLAGYTDMARRAIESEAYIWLHGDQEGARRMYDRQRDWARKLTPSQRWSRKWGAWYANQGLTGAAITEIQLELGDCRDCGKAPADPHTSDTRARHAARETAICS